MEFGGWEMPLAYPQGTLAEHRACRQDSVAFDVSHLGTVRVEGPDAFDRLQAALSNDLRRVGPGRAQYTHLLDERRLGGRRHHRLVAVRGRLRRHAQRLQHRPGGRRPSAGEDTTAARAVIAVQGPHARTRLAAVAPEAAGGAAVPGRPVRVGRRGLHWPPGTGYTGEDGVELAVPADAADALWTALLAAGIQPAGLGARDTLRLEAALPLHGHELGPGITPLQAGLGWVVGWDKAELPGPGRPGGRAPATACAAVWSGWPPRAVSRPAKAARSSPTVAPVGTVTSGNFSPMLGHGIALALRRTVEPDGGDATAGPAWASSSATGPAGPGGGTPFVRPGSGHPADDRYRPRHWASARPVR